MCGASKEIGIFSSSVFIVLKFCIFKEKVFLRKLFSLGVKPFIICLFFTANFHVRNHLLPEVEGHTALALEQTFNSVHNDLTFVFNSLATKVPVMFVSFYFQRNLIFEFSLQIYFACAFVD